MRLKLNLAIYKKLTIIVICFQVNFTFAQDAIIQEVALPAEIKTINTLISNKQDLLWIGTGRLMVGFGVAMVRRFKEKS